AYREEQGFDHFAVALSVGVQRMVRSDKAGSGVMFSLDTETGFPDVVVIDAAWGLGETVVQGTVNPDEYRVFKPLLERGDCAPIVEKTRGDKQHKMVYARGGDHPTKTVATSKKQQRAFVLSDDEILQLARWACAIEAHYGRPMDMEWAKDGADGELTIIQARPETVQSQRSQRSFTAYTLRERGEELARGLAIGESIAVGPARCIDNPDEGDRVAAGDILVTSMTDPDWVPIMKRAAAIVTDHGGRTSHAAIVSRELGVAATVGCNDATGRIADGDTVTVSCAEGDQGVIYRGELAYDEQEVVVEDLPEAPVDLMVNIATPSAAFRWWRLPTRGVGLARMEFIINNQIKAHPLSLTRFDTLTDPDDRAAISELTAGYDDKTEYFVDHLARGIAAIASAQHPHPTVVRLSDFKSNEYAALLGGSAFEPSEANPMLGFRGASRYYHDNYRDGFALECRALKRAREQIGLDNIIVMVPFVRTLDEADRVLATMAANGLVRGENGLQVYVMCEIPANVLLARDFAQRFDGFSIGSNDLTQLILGIDRDSDLLGPLFDERDPAVLKAIATVIEQVQAEGCKIGICGQAPSDHPEFARFLVEHGIDSMSLNPDSVIEVLRALG
ncbi:MAG: phosphoenolpyruvate synthase, partial [Planctomycetota bacterium]